MDEQMIKDLDEIKERINARTRPEVVRALIQKHKAALIEVRL